MLYIQIIQHFNQPPEHVTVEHRLLEQSLRQGFEEGRREVQRILQFASAAPAAPDLLPYLCRTFLFSPLVI
jgi:hypothetical protein